MDLKISEMSVLEKIKKVDIKIDKLYKVKKVLENKLNKIKEYKKLSEISKKQIESKKDILNKISEEAELQHIGKNLYLDNYNNFFKHTKINEKDNFLMVKSSNTKKIEYSLENMQDLAVDNGLKIKNELNSMVIYSENIVKINKVFNTIRKFADIKNYSIIIDAKSLNDRVTHKIDTSFLRITFKNKDKIIIEKI